ncbi:hypothetical protein [Fischerella thermalis]|uniref:hypothetical protein n=1 Tax=Fischerella thermalis TaxID=372787 RepID=UPI0019F6F0F4|nr:hypothetical protein [Fischerella thermalis]MBF1990837.1 hypothetical protein [Fischerella thermalis M58_A2018_009]MBF2061269.1 hypothetical protein [Fischerella thermalis M66_A2018_004]
MAKIERVSINFKLPQPLVEALKAKAREQQTTATDLVIQGLHHVLGVNTTGIDNILHEITTRIAALETKQESDSHSKDNSRDNRLHSLADSAESKRLSTLEQKLEVVMRRMEVLEIAIASGKYSNNNRQRKPAYPYQQVSVELQAIPAQNLASRLGLTASSLDGDREKLTTPEFISWTRNRDPRSIGWQFHPEDGLYHPVQQ